MRYFLQVGGQFSLFAGHTTLLHLLGHASEDYLGVGGGHVNFGEGIGADDNLAQRHETNFCTAEEECNQ